jgi:hypothetical protein
MAKAEESPAKGRPKRGARVNPAEEGAPPSSEARLAAQVAAQAASELVRTASVANDQAIRAVQAAAVADAPIVESRAPDRADRWVVLIYMAVTSPELRGIMEGDLAEMATQLRLLGPDDLRVYALMDTADGGYAVRHRVHHTPTGEPDLAIVHPDLELGDKIGRKAAYLSKLIQWRFASAPAGEFETGVSRFGKTILVLWGHSQGVAAALSMPGSPTYAMVGNGGFGFSEFSGDSLSLPQIRRAIAAGLRGDQHIDILSFDSCFMSAAEVSAEFQSEPPPFTRRRPCSSTVWTTVGWWTCS